MDLDQLRHDGYAVAEQVVPPALIAAAIAALHERSDGTPGMVPIWGHQALWDVRQHPSVHAAFAEACGTEELWVSLDRVSINAPGGPGLSIHWDIDLEGHVPTPVPARAGDLIVFDALLPHGNEANGAATPRLAQYVAMREPHAWGGTAAGRVALYEEGRSAFGEYAGIVEPWPPATLTPLGRRLLGLDAWPSAARRP